MVREISSSSSQAYLNETQQRQHVDPVAEIGGTAAAGKPKSDTADELELSPQAQMAELLEKGPFWQLLGVESKGGAIHVEDIRSAYKEQFSHFTREVDSRLREAGVDMSQEFTLRSDSMGGVIVAGDHPDKETIEALFESDPDLANRFRGMGAAASLLHAADEAAPFHEAYAKDPYAAVDRYSYLFDDNRQAIFSLRFGVEGAEEFFTGG